METFKDYNGATVRLAFARNQLSKEPQHVLTICRYVDAWLLTKHKLRGLEFPGGKVEAGEMLEDAARREVYEETGATVKELQFIGEYEVDNGSDSFVKAIFYGEVDGLEESDNYYETAGPVLIKENLLTQRFGEEYSFIMKDEVIKQVLLYIEKQKSGR
ncbi:nucleoside triphosphatase YtkD [Robertmurraya yapensis]|uniref:Nucleoside triphosphatase YtkD n=1 Tax=Bacillus yapensis TaxID=2492960 RepID=A0A431W259_9BACI|nr:nucleoside triphosphatase YtkD [Bacillus yapensis]RTR29517.1 nucleoside triphosphatase YtkD [Bacillus yapensis]TKS94863.1 nucleoside triphosphatase YtkD [Bacillus yapensis]